MTNSPPTAHVAEKTYPKLSTIISAIAIIFLVIAFISGKTVQFYASFLFFFYSLTTSMWISVIMLGIFQTFLMIPIRIINLIKGANTEDFKKTVVEQDQEQEQQFLIKKHARGGTPIFLWYTVSLFIQTISYISMGRLFLIDFYTKPLNPDLLYSWVPYPDYPIQGIIFKIPYIAPTDTKNLGARGVITAWLILIGIRILFYVFRYIYRQFKKSKSNNSGKMPGTNAIKQAVNLWNGSFLIIMIGAFFLMRNFPTGFELKIFAGSVAVPNRTLNTITALATAFTIILLDLSKMRKKSVLARAQGISEDVIQSTETKNFRQSLRNGGLLGLGAFFISNQIPSAFELSIFTLEIISWMAPFTIDKIILRVNKKAVESSPKSDPKPKESSEPEKTFTTKSIQEIQNSS